MALYKTRNNIISGLNQFDTLTVAGIDISSTINQMQARDNLFQQLINDDATITTNISSALTDCAYKSSTNTFTGSNTFNNTVTLGYTPSSNSDAVSKLYVDNGLASKQSTIGSTTDLSFRNLTLSGDITLPDSSINQSKINNLSTSLNEKQNLIGSTTDLAFRDLSVTGNITIPLASIGMNKINNLQTSLDAKQAKLDNTVDVSLHDILSLRDINTCRDITSTRNTALTNLSVTGTLTLPTNCISQSAITNLTTDLSNKQPLINGFTSLSCNSVSCNTLTVPDSSIPIAKISGLSVKQDTLTNASNVTINQLNAQVIGANNIGCQDITLQSNAKSIYFTTNGVQKGQINLSETDEMVINSNTGKFLNFNVNGVPKYTLNPSGIPTNSIDLVTKNYIREYLPSRWTFQSNASSLTSIFVPNPSSVNFNQQTIYINFKEALPVQNVILDLNVFQLHSQQNSYAYSINYSGCCRYNIIYNVAQGSTPASLTCQLISSNLVNYLTHFANPYNYRITNVDYMGFQVATFTMVTNTKLKLDIKWLMTGFNSGNQINWVSSCGASVQILHGKPKLATGNSFFASAINDLSNTDYLNNSSVGGCWLSNT